MSAPLYFYIDVCQYGARDGSSCASDGPRRAIVRLPERMAPRPDEASEQGPERTRRGIAAEKAPEKTRPRADSRSESSRRMAEPVLEMQDAEPDGAVLLLASSSSLCLTRHPDDLRSRLVRSLSSVPTPCRQTIRPSSSAKTRAVISSCHRAVLIPARTGVGVMSGPEMNCSSGSAPTVMRPRYGVSRSTAAKAAGCGGRLSVALAVTIGPESTGSHSLGPGTGAVTAFR